MDKNSGGPAFPNDGLTCGTALQDGMSLRDYFAAASLTGLISQLRDAANTQYVDIAESAYAMADAMLSERAK